MAIADCGFIERFREYPYTVPPVVGKSYLACAIGRQAAHSVFKTL